MRPVSFLAARRKSDDDEKEEDDDYDEYLTVAEQQASSTSHQIARNLHLIPLQTFARCEWRAFASGLMSRL